MWRDCRIDHELIHGTIAAIRFSVAVMRVLSGCACRIAAYAVQRPIEGRSKLGNPMWSQARRASRAIRNWSEASLATVPKFAWN